MRSLRHLRPCLDNARPHELPIVFVLLLLVLSVIVALLRGGRIHTLLTLQIRHLWLFFVPLLLQLIAFSPLGDQLVQGIPLARLLYIPSLFIAATALAFNRQLPGTLWIAIGLVSNALVIALNGGFMPVSAEARALAGMPPLLEREMNVIPMTNGTVLPWLADIIPLPSFLPFANVISVGDVLVAIGGMIFIQRTLVPPRRSKTTP